MQRLLGDEYAAFAAAMEEKPVSGLRVNTLKISAEEFTSLSPIPLGERVAWCDAAFTLTSGPSPDGRGVGVREPGKHPYHIAGLYYLQDPSAMSAAALLDPQPGERVLDLAAAPGGKTTQLAALMQGQGLLVANEIKDKRVGHLAINVERWGAGNVVITNESPERLADHFGAYFDRVLVDAPCSGEGMFRKDIGARSDWSPEMVAGCAVRQANILRVAAKLVRPGGLLGYSTCTFAPEEDEGVVNGLIHGFTDRNGLGQFEVVELPQLAGFMRGRPEWLGSIEKGTGLEGAVRLFPQRVNGEGHFVCVLRKKDGREAHPSRYSRDLSPSRGQLALWEAFAGEVLKVELPHAHFQVYGERLYLTPQNLPPLSGLRVIHPGVWLGTFKKERFEPAHPLALFLQRGQAGNVLDLSSEGATSRSPLHGGSGERPTGVLRDRSLLQRYLGGESIPAEGASGWTLVTVDGWPLGWGKRVQGVVKNHYPRGWQVYS
jgi:NOL1/NOP2/sun family putative RNA methylase